MENLLNDLDKLQGNKEKLLNIHLDILRKNITANAYNEWTVQNITQYPNLSLDDRIKQLEIWIRTQKQTPSPSLPPSPILPPVATQVYPSLINGKANPALFKYSDHLPIIKTINIEGHPIKVASFNVLYFPWLLTNINSAQNVKDYTGHIGKYYPQLFTHPTWTNHQGQPITIYDTEERMLSKNEGIREIIRNLFKIHKVDILGIQEFDPSEIDYLKQLLRDPSVSYEIIIPSDSNGYNQIEEDKITNQPPYILSIHLKEFKFSKNDLQIVIYNPRKVTHNQTKSHLLYYNSWKTTPTGDCLQKLNQIKPTKRIMNISFSIGAGMRLMKDQEFRFINTHVQFCDQQTLVDYVKNIKKPQDYIQQNKPYYIIIVGDINATQKIDKDYIGGPNDPELLMYVNNKLINLPFSHIDTKGTPELYDYIWHVIK
jgi:hypothetical protein